jgi:hypothetical protein
MAYDSLGICSASIRGLNDNVHYVLKKDYNRTTIARAQPIMANLSIALIDHICNTE